jgi:hypothetical protein
MPIQGHKLSKATYLLIDQLGDLLWSRSAVLTVVLDTKVLINATWVVGRRENEGAESLDSCM